MSKHTPEPWVFSCGAIFQEHGASSIAKTHGAELFNGTFTNRAMINARINADALRIVACVNACAGMDDPAQEIQSLKAGNEKLEAMTKQLDDAESKLNTAISTIYEVERVISEQVKNGSFELDDLLGEVNYCINRIDAAPKPQGGAPCDTGLPSSKSD